MFNNSLENNKNIASYDN